MRVGVGTRQTRCWVDWLPSTVIDMYVGGWILIVWVHRDEAPKNKAVVSGPIIVESVAVVFTTRVLEDAGVR